MSCAAAAVLPYWMARVAMARRCLSDLEVWRQAKRTVAQCLDGLRGSGAQVFHDVRGDGCRLDHVIISRRGVFVVETHSVPKPWPKAKVYVQGRKLLVAGQYLERDPRVAAAAAARWVESFLRESTGKRFVARGIVAFPGWYVQQADPPGPVWVIEPKALAALLDHERATVTTADMALAAWHLSRYVQRTRYVRTDLARAA
jgi:Nuclease-related domain